MAWMDEYEWDFVKDSMDKKNIARSASHTRTHCGKGGAVKFPSDYMSKKELKAMSGEVIQYASLKKPMSWEEFKALPDDLKKEYIKWIRDEFDAPDCYIYRMLGVSGRYFGLIMKDIGMVGGSEKGSRRKWKKEQFYAWAGFADMNTEVKPVQEETVEEPDEEAVLQDPETTGDFSSLSDTESCGNSFEVVCAVPVSGQMSFNCDANEALNALRLLLGNKNVNLVVSWTVQED
jgi:hypothetical protein